MILRLVGISLIVLICGVILRQYNKPFSTLLSIGAGILTMLIISDKVYDLLSSVKGIMSVMPQSAAYITLMVKALCIILITQLVCDICRDNGENALASFTETGARIVVISLALPLFENIISIVTGLTK